MEQEAARLVFDEEYPQDEVKYKNAFYPGGRIGQHKVVMGVQTKPGLSQATLLAERMLAGFPNIKYFLLVGIAGGVPKYGPAGATSQIVLGDVVISSPRGNYGGVIQYDRGAWQGHGHLNYQGHTNGVPQDLMMAVNNFRSEGWPNTKISETLNQMRVKLDEQRRYQYDDPGPLRDRLFNDEYDHKGTDTDDCKGNCDTEFVNLRIDRGETAKRRIDEPRVHFGNIASSNQLQISATERNRILREHEAICFEMEAAGVMQDNPCVVVRGICDYADSHKNKGWQNYAAATAAACAKGLLSKIPAIEVTENETSTTSSSHGTADYSTNFTLGDNNRGDITNGNVYRGDVTNGNVYRGAYTHGNIHNGDVVNGNSHTSNVTFGNSNRGFQAGTINGPVHGLRFGGT